MHPQEVATAYAAALLDGSTHAEAFRALMAQCHPANGGSPEAMQALNAAFAASKEPAAPALPADDDQPGEEEDTAPAGMSPEEIESKLAAALASVHNLPGVAIERAGNWLWVSGDTKPHRVALKENGFQFASKKVMWYYRPFPFRFRRRGGEKPIEEIRSKYGSTQLR
jgi:hypothetical protein